jgi:regulator of replication initiation timing
MVMIYDHLLFVFEYFQTELTTLRNDLMELVTENRCLSDKLKAVLSTKFTAESTISPHHKKQSDMLTNLQQQLCLTAQVCSY